VMKPMQIAGCFLAGLLSLSGCQTTKSPPPSDLTEQQARQNQMEQTIAEQQRQIAQLSGEVESLRGFSSERLNALVHVKAVELGRFTRLLDSDHNGIPDHVVIYLELQDSQGDEIKAAGSATLELWDLGAPPEQQKVARWDFDLNQVSQRWRGGMMADHYLFELELPSNPPISASSFTLRVCFTEALTGQTFEAQSLLDEKFIADEKK
jgi:hypothetical protein